MIGTIHAYKTYTQKVFLITIPKILLGIIHIASRAVTTELVRGKGGSFLGLSFVVVFTVLGNLLQLCLDSVRQ
jgi:hypothetical protein